VLRQQGRRPAVTTASSRKKEEEEKKKTQKFNEPLPTHTIEEEEYPCCVEKVQIYR
jgi:hypothetical protein